jgi:hypothetical protein
MVESIKIACKSGWLIYPACTAYLPFCRHQRKKRLNAEFLQLTTLTQGMLPLRVPWQLICGKFEFQTFLRCCEYEVWKFLHTDYSQCPDVRKASIDSAITCIYARAAGAVGRTAS